MLREFSAEKSTFFFKYRLKSLQFSVGSKELLDLFIFVLIVRMTEEFIETIVSFSTYKYLQEICQI